MLTCQPSLQNKLCINCISHVITLYFYWEIKHLNLEFTRATSVNRNILDFECVLFSCWISESMFYFVGGIWLHSQISTIKSHCATVNVFANLSGAPFTTWLTKPRTCISKHTHCFMWDIVTHICSNFNGGGVAFLNCNKRNNYSSRWISHYSLFMTNESGLNFNIWNVAI